MAGHLDCYVCMVQDAENLAKWAPDKNSKFKFMQECLKLLVDSDYETTATHFHSKIHKLAQTYFNVYDFYKDEKMYFNQKLLELEPDIDQMSGSSADSLYDSMRIATSGNIIDLFFGQISLAHVKKMIIEALEKDYNYVLYNDLINDISKASKLLYLADNAGEIVLDKIFIKKIKERYPKLSIYFGVRGEPVLNDATEQDAYMIGINKYAEIINNGTCIPGTDLDKVSAQFKQVFSEADIIISKGIGNFETLCGCKANVYYLLLCKCQVLQRKFNRGHCDHLFTHERFLSDEQINF
ncbi:MAG: damage-control phosphatase ARMT1 family protein [Eubacteriales bacterium]